MFTRRECVLGAAGVPFFIGAIAEADPRSDLTDLSIEQASRLIRHRQVSSVELTIACLDRINRYDHLLNAFIALTSDFALHQATTLDEELRRGRWRGPLHGIPISLKDNIDLAGFRTTGASAVRRNAAPASSDAEVVRRLKFAGAVILGKTNMVEFAAGGPVTTSTFGPIRNPWSLDRTPGGSSSGAAAAVASRMCFAAVGTDTGGSIRGPAGSCGITGLKTSYGRVSNRGIIPYTWSLDTVGPLARSAVDAAIVLQAMAGYDRYDPSSLDELVPRYMREIFRPVRKLRIGLVRRFFEDQRPEEAPSIEEAVRMLAALTSTVRDVQVPFVDPEVFVLLQRAEAYAYHRETFDRAPELYNPYFRLSLNRAKSMNVADYAAARHDLERLRREIDAVFDEVDLIITPMRSNAEKIAEIKPPETYSTAGARMRNPALQMNAFGIPALSMPCGFAKIGLPVGLQVAGPKFGEGRVLRLTRAYQERTTWHTATPSFAPRLG